MIEQAETPTDPVPKLSSGTVLSAVISEQDMTGRHPAWKGVRKLQISQESGADDQNRKVAVNRGRFSRVFQSKRTG
jgi:hypothetical protein